MPILEEYYTDETLTNKWIDNPNFPDHDEYKGAVVDYARDCAESTCWYYIPHTSEHSFGIHVAKMAGMPQAVWSRPVIRPASRPLSRRSPRTTTH